VHLKAHSYKNTTKQASNEHTFDPLPFGHTGKVGLYDPKVMHFDLELREAIQSALTALPFKEAKFLPLHRTVRNRKPILRHNRFFALKAFEEMAAENEAAAAPDAAPAAAAGGGGAAPRTKWRLKPERADVDALLKAFSSESADENPAALVKIARERGLLWSESDVTKFISGVAKKEQTLQVFTILMLRKVLLCRVSRNRYFWSGPMMCALFRLMLIKNKFPALHKRLNISIVPTEQQQASMAISEASFLPSLPAAPPADLSAGVAFPGKYPPRRSFSCSAGLVYYLAKLTHQLV